MISSLVALGLASQLAAVALAAPLDSPLSQPTARGQADSTNLTEIIFGGHLAHYTPQYDVDWGLPRDPPSGCEVTFVNLLERHGARFPTDKSQPKLKASVEKLAKASSIEDKAFDFVKDYKFELGSDTLVPFGRKQAFDSGKRFIEKYAKLAKRSLETFVRAADSFRVVETAQLFRLGYRGESIDDSKPDVDVKLPEESTFNNTLNIRSCPLENDQSIDIGQSIADIYATIWVPKLTAKWNKVFPGADLTDSDILHFFELCAFETVANDGKISDWCKVFDPSDIAHYHYYQSLEKYYGSSYGHPLGRTRGIGFANELLARLTSKPVHDSTTTNSTLDSDKATFPLPPSDKDEKGHRMFADFSHDNDMLTILSALDLARPSNGEDLPFTTRQSPPPNSLWDVSKLVPFAGRVAFEKLSCPKRKDGHEFVRVVINEGVYPLPWKECGDSGKKEGLCELGVFVESQKWAREGGDWGDCFA